MIYKNECIYVYKTYLQTFKLVHKNKFPLTKIKTVHKMQKTKKKNSFLHSRYARGTFQKAGSLNSWYESQTREKMIHRRRESHSLKLKIIQHHKHVSCKSPESPTNEMYRTPNSTLDADDDDSGLDVFCTPNADITLMKMKSMNNLHDPMVINSGGNLSRMKSLDNIGDTPTDLIRLKHDFENKRFNNAKQQSLSNLNNGFDDVDGFIERRHHSTNSSSPVPPSANEINRLSLQTPKRRVGNTKYVGADSLDENQQQQFYQLLKMHSLGTIADIVNNNMKSSDQMWNVNGNTNRNTISGVGFKYDKRYIVPIRLEEKYSEVNGNIIKGDDDDDVFKVPQAKTMMIPLRKEKSSSCIDSMKNRGSTLYDRLR